MWVWYVLVPLGFVLEPIAHPFHPPPQEGHEGVVEQLLKAGADAEKATNDGTTPLYIACQVCVGYIRQYVER